MYEVFYTDIKGGWEFLLATGNPWRADAFRRRGYLVRLAG